MSVGTIINYTTTAMHRLQLSSPSLRLLEIRLLISLFPSLGFFHAARAASVFLLTEKHPVFLRAP